MAYLDGFTYVEGPYSIRWSTLSSLATVRARNPVGYEAESRTIIEATSDMTQIFGIIQADAANSMANYLSGKCQIMVPTDQTVFATKTQTGVVASKLTVGQVFDIEKSGNFMRLDTDSISSGKLITVERGMSGICYDSEDSSIFVQFLREAIGPFGSHASQRYLEQ